MKKKDMSGSAIVKRQIIEEDKVIGNLKKQFFRPTLQAQRAIGISPAIANGNIALAYHRGLAAAREDTIKSIINKLKKEYPAAAKFVKDNFKP